MVSSETALSWESWHRAGEDRGPGSLRGSMLSPGASGQSQPPRSPQVVKRKFQKGWFVLVVVVRTIEPAEEGINKKTAQLSLVNTTPGRPPSAPERMCPRAGVLPGLEAPGGAGPGGWASHAGPAQETGDTGQCVKKAAGSGTRPS